MTDRDPAQPSKANDLIASMGWEPLPYSCTGLLRSTEIGSSVVWSWLVLIPWASNDAKPWIDGTHTFEQSLLSREQQRDRILQHMRELLDDRYGETVGRRAADDLIERIFNLSLIHI